MADTRARPRYNKNMTTGATHPEMFETKLAKAVMKDYSKIMDVFNNAASVALEFHGHQYRGSVAEIKAGEYLIFKVKNINDGLVRVPEGYDLILLRLLTTKGEVFTYRTQLKKKKIPLLLLKFPEGEAKTSMRAHRRYCVNMNTPIVLSRRVSGPLPRNLTGLGTIINVSEGGCAVNTALKLEKEDTIKLFFNLSDSTGDKSVELTGDVKRVGEPVGRMVNYGIQFTQLTSQISRQIKEFIKRFSSQTSTGSMAGNAESN